LIRVNATAVDVRNHHEATFEKNEEPSPCAWRWRTVDVFPKIVSNDSYNSNIDNNVLKPLSMNTLKDSFVGTLKEISSSFV
jgi:hypothetical protein